MTRIIDPIDPLLIEQELTENLFLRDTNKGNNKIYIFSSEEAPNIMREVGRLREESFRTAGGGTGLDCDIDEFDTMPNGYKQLIVWNEEQKAIVGGYRFILGRQVIENPKGTQALATSHMFSYSDSFVREYLPYTIELGRSFVTNSYQSTSEGSLSIFALDNLWDGLGALTKLYPETKYFFGKVTMYSSYDPNCRNLILKFMDIYFKDHDSLVVPFAPLPIDISPEKIQEVFCQDDIKKDFRSLKKAVREYGFIIPPLISAYISLSDKLKVLGTAINDEFGYVEETGILIAIEEILEEKKQRHIDTFTPSSF